MERYALRNKMSGGFFTNHNQADTESPIDALMFSSHMIADVLAKTRVGYELVKVSIDINNVQTVSTVND